jgi:hypothetical protein
MADSPIDFRSKLKPLPPVSLNAILDTHEQHDTSGSHHSSDHGKHGPVENSGDHLSHAERVARFQHLKSILEPFKHSPDAAEALSKKQVKVQRPEGRPAKPRKVSILAEGAQQVVYDPSFEAKMKRFLARTKEFFSPNSENSFFAVFGKGSAQEAEQSAFNFVMLICTVYALYVPDIYIASYTAPGSDVVIFTITNFVLFLFFIEFAYYSLFKKDYFNSFFFWLDLVSTASLIPDALDLYGKGLQAPADEFTSSRSNFCCIPFYFVNLLFICTNVSNACTRCWFCTGASINRTRWSSCQSWHQGCSCGQNFQVDLDSVAEVQGAERKKEAKSRLHGP